MKILKKVKEIRSRKGELHFVRYALVECDAFALYVHKIYKADEDVHLHDHPWSFVGMVLNGSYVEEYDDGNERASRQRLPFMPALTRATGYYHKILSINNSPVTTLVLRGKRSHDWGYKTAEGFVEASEYRRRKLMGTLPE